MLRSSTDRNNDRLDAASTPEEALESPGTNAATGEMLPTPPKHLAGLPVILTTDDLVAATMERIMAAENPEAVLANPESFGLRDYSGEVIVITGVRGIMPSTIKGQDYYLVFEAIVKEGDGPVTLTTGSPYAAGAIVKLAKEGWLPRPVRVVSLESASNPGQASLWVVNVPEVKGLPGDEAGF